MSRLVSVVTVFHNRARHVAASVGSLLAQTHDSLEIIVVDDGSSDGTATELRKLHDHRLDVRVQENTGFTIAIDRAVRSAKGDVIAIHGSGDISAPTRIKRQLAALEAHPKVVVAGCMVTNEASELRLPTSNRVLGTAMDFTELLQTYPMTHGEAMFHKPLFEQVGGYRPFFQLGQDYDLWLRMAEHGSFLTVPEPLYRRRQFENSINTNALKLMAQAHYGDFAKQCAVIRERHGYDPLERFGNAGALMARPSSELSSKLGSMGLKELLRDNDEVSRILIAASLNKGKNIRSLGAAALANLKNCAPAAFGRVAGLWTRGRD